MLTRLAGRLLVWLMDRFDNRFTRWANETDGEDQL